MLHNQASNEITLVSCVSEGEERVVTLVLGPSYTLLERSQGPVTELAYGAAAHTHKMTFQPAAAARALEVAPQEVPQALERLFAPQPGVAQLSDIMDAFDRAGERYAYASWTGARDIAFRGGAQ